MCVLVPPGILTRHRLSKNIVLGVPTVSRPFINKTSCLTPILYLGTKEDLFGPRRTFLDQNAFPLDNKIISTFN